MKLIRDVLVRGRVFIMGSGMRSFEDIGRGYPDDTLVSIAPNIRLEPYSTFWEGSVGQLVTMGSFSYTGSRLSPAISIGRYTSVASGLRVMGNRHPLERVSSSPVFYKEALMMRTYQEDEKCKSNFQPYVESSGAIKIGNDVWIGQNVTIAQGITIGNGSVVASNAVVTKSISPYSVVGGVPAKKIRDRFSHSVIADLERLEWWRYAPSAISDIDMTDPERFCGIFRERVENRTIRPFEPPFLDYNNFASLIGR